MSQDTLHPMGVSRLWSESTAQEAERSGNGQRSSRRFKLDRFTPAQSTVDWSASQIGLKRTPDSLLHPFFPLPSSCFATRDTPPHRNFRQLHLSGRPGFRSWLGDWSQKGGNTLLSKKKTKLDAQLGDDPDFVFPSYPLTRKKLISRNFSGLW